MQSGFRCLKKYWLEDISVVYSFLMQSYKSKSCFLFLFSSAAETAARAARLDSRKRKSIDRDFRLRSHSEKTQKKLLFYFSPVSVFILCCCTHFLSLHLFATIFVFSYYWSFLFVFLSSKEGLLLSWKCGTFLACGLSSKKGNIGQCPHF